MKEMIIQGISEDGKEFEKTVSYRPMTRKEVKVMRKMLKDNKDMLVDELMEYVLTTVMSEADFNVVENEAYNRVFVALYDEINKETFGAKEEEKN